MNKSLLIVGMSKTYPMKIYKAFISIIIIYTGIALGFIVIPVIWSIEFGPEMVVRDIDLKILESTKYDLDSSHEGSKYLLNNLLQPEDTSEISQFDSIAETKTIFTRSQMQKLQILNHRIAPALQSTYFNRDSMMVFPPDGIPDSTFAQYLKGVSFSYKYATVWRLLIKGLIEKGELNQALSLSQKYLSFYRAIGESDLGLAYSISATVDIKKINKALLSNLNSIKSTKMLEGLYNTVHKNSSDPEWVMNALRIEWFRIRATFNSEYAKELLNENYFKDSLGFPGIPPYLLKKIFDLEETNDIHDHVWARILYLATDTPSISIVNGDSLPYLIPEIKWTKEGSKGQTKLFLGKNIAGRILVAVAVPYYIGYVRDARKSRKHALFTAEAIRLRMHYLTSKRNLSSFQPNETGYKKGEITFDKKERTLRSMYIYPGDTTRLEYKVE